MIEELRLGVDHVVNNVPAAAPSAIDFTTVFASFGASVPLFLWLLKMHRDLIGVVIPRGFRLIRREIRRQGEDSKERHQEHMEDLHAITIALVRQTKTRAVKTSRRYQRKRKVSAHKPTTPSKKKRKRLKA